MKTMRTRWLVLLLVCGLVSGWSGWGARAAADALDGWTLVFSDDFDRDEIGEDWQVADGTWAVADGALVGSGAVISARGFPGDHPHGFIRMEFEAVTDVKPFLLIPGTTPSVSVSDLSSFIHAEPLSPEANVWGTGYFFQFGGFMNTQNRIRRAGRELVADRDPKILIEQDKTHRIVVENDQGTLRMTVDGKRLFEYREEASRIGEGFDRVGLYIHTRARINWVRVYVKRLPDDMI